MTVLRSVFRFRPGRIALLAVLVGMTVLGAVVDHSRGDLAHRRVRFEQSDRMITWWRHDRPRLVHAAPRQPACVAVKGWATQCR